MKAIIILLLIIAVIGVIAIVISGQNGVLDFDALGYDKEEQQFLGESKL